MEENLKPLESRLRAARELPALVRDYLKGCSDFPTVDPHTRLAGSYAQHLSVSDVKDVDILVRVDGDPEENDPSAKQIISDLLASLKDLPESDEPLGSWRVSHVEVTGARRSVHVYFEDEDFHLDIVAFIAPDGLDKPVFVPDKDYDTWVKSHPLGIVDLVKELDEQYGGKVRKLGKVLKHYRNHNMRYMRPKSYWLLSLLLNAVQNGDLDMEQQLPELFRDLLAVIYDGFAQDLEKTDAVPPIPDPLLGHDVAHSWKRHDFEAFMALLVEGKSRMDRALKAVSDGKLADAVEICQRMFGSECFPTSVDDVMKQLAALYAPGTSYGLVGGGLSATKPNTGPYVQTVPTRFYGE
jgi:hypothetical protein